MSTPQSRVEEQRLEWALAETFGTQTPPDLTGAVRRRLAATASEARPPHRSRAAAAAVLLLGGLAVAYTWASRRAPESVEPVAGERASGDAQDPVAAPEWVTVRSFGEIEDLPAAIQYVRGINLSDADIAALAERDLRGLRLEVRWYRDRDRPLRFASGRALGIVARMHGLRALHLDGQANLQSASLRELAALPMLHELGLQRIDTSDSQLAALVEFPSLARVDLTLNHGFGADGLRAVLDCPGLRSLLLRGCSQLDGAALQALTRARHLRELDLGDIGRSFRGFIGEPGDAALYALQHDARLPTTSQPLAFEDLIFVTELPALEVIGLGGTAITDDDVRRLRQSMPGLREVRLADCERITDVAVAELLALEHLTTLDLSRCPGVSAFSIPLLARAGPLRTLVLDGHDWLTDEHRALLNTPHSRLVPGR